MAPTSRAAEGSLERRLLSVTVSAPYVLILLGIYTAAIGAGLSCDARWPLCDGAVFGLFPATWPSFVEWFHRLIAMLTGALILGSWVVVWRMRSSRRAIAAFTVAVALLPLQIWLGAQTVFTYELVTVTAHFLTALIIFGAVLLGGAWALGWSGAGTGSPRRLFALALGLFVPFVALTPHFLVAHPGVVQVAYYAIGLTILSALLLVGGVTSMAVPVGWRRRAIGGLAWGGVLLITGQLLAGRLVRSPAVEVLDWSGALATLLVLALGIWLSGTPSDVGGRDAPPVTE